MRSVKHYESNTKRNCIFCCVPKKIWIMLPRSHYSYCYYW